MPKDYLGDGVYADTTDDGGIVLTTENNISYASNTIFLEPSVLDALERYLARLGVCKERHGK